jgi:hypothetical protein
MQPVSDKLIGKDLKGTDGGLIEVEFRNLPEGGLRKTMTKRN